jgi:signal transduction histidine kinase
MNFYALSALVNGLAATALGALVYSRAPRNIRHLTYCLFCLGVSIWSYAYFAWQLAETESRAMTFVRLLMAGSTLIPIFYFHHILSILGLVERYRFPLRAGYALGGCFLLLVPTPWFVADLQPAMSFRYWPKPGPIFHFYLLWFVGYALLTIYLIVVSYKHAKGIRRNQCLYLLIGTLIGYAGGATNFPLWYGIRIPPDGTILASVYVSIVAYTMLRYRLLDFSVAVERGLTYLFLVELIFLPTYPLLVMAQKAYFGAISHQFSLILFLLFTMALLGAYRIKPEAQAAIGRTLFRGRYDMYETLSAFSKALVTILDLDSLTKEIVRTLARVIDIKTASLFLLNKEQGLYVLASSHGFNPDDLPSLRLSTGNALPLHLASHQSILVREEFEHAAGRIPKPPVLDTLRVMRSEVCLPLINKDQLIGFCNLGPRTNHQMFSEDELSLLTTLAQNAAIALDNAMLYEDLRRSQTLMRRTDRLRSLETIAGGFAHEIRNPLTSIKTFVQLAPERRNDSDFMDHFSQVVSEDVARIERLIQEILDYARYMEPKFMAEDLNDIVSSCLYFVEVKADSKAISIEKDLASDLPPVMLDRQQIKQVLLNLFLNAMEAMAECGGRLRVKTHRLTKQHGRPWVQIEVADTGPGISPTNLEHIFDPFYTTKHASEEREGTGLGLTIVHQIVQEHRGSIEVQSAVGRGTSFFVNLPTSPIQSGIQKELEEHEEADPLGR